MESIEVATSLGLKPVKINCVVMKGVNDQEVLDFIELTRTKPVDVRFIEYMPFDGNRWNEQKFVPYKKILNTISNRYPIIKLPGELHDTSKVCFN